MATRYWLSCDWVVGRTATHVVCLHIKKGGCLWIAGKHSNSLCEYVSGWPAIENRQSASYEDASTGELLRSLIEQGVLVSQRLRGKEAFPISLPRVTDLLAEEYEPRRVKVSATDLARFARAVVMALPLSLVGDTKCVAYLHRRRKSASGTSSFVKEQDSEGVNKIRIHHAKFLSMRPILWRSRNQDWFERLVLFNFLRYSGARPAWVLGVSAEPPPRVHSWLQYGTLSVDAVPAEISGFVAVAAL